MATSKKPRKKHDKNANIKRQSDRICRNSLVLPVIGLGNNGTDRNIRTYLEKMYRKKT